MIAKIQENNIVMMIGGLQAELAFMVVKRYFNGVGQAKALLCVTALPPLLLLLSV